MAIAPDSAPTAHLARTRLTTAMFCVGLAIALSICYAVVQPDVLRGFEQIRNSVAVSVCLLLLPQGYWNLLRWLKRSPQLDVGLDAIVTLLGLVALVGFSWLGSHLSVNFMPMFWVLAVVLLGLSFRQFVPSKLEWRHRAVGAIVLAFYVYLACMIWGTQYMTPRPMAKLLAGTLPIDTLFHSSIAAMIQTYGIPSTGLDGPIYMPYHTGSHWLFAQLASLVDLSVFRFYNLAYPVLILPLLFRSILAFAVDLRVFGDVVSSEWDLRKDWRFWGLISVSFMGFLPSPLIAQLGIGLNSSLISQSHLLALSLAFLTLCFCLCLIKQFQASKFSLSSGALILSIGLLLSLVTLSKVSVGFLLFSIVFYAVLRLQLYKQCSIWVGLIAAIALQLLVLKYMGYLGTPPQSSTPLQLFAYLDTYVESAVRVFSLPIMLFWSIIYLSLRFKFMQLSTIADLIKASRAGIIVDAEILAITCFLGLIPGLLLNIAGGSAYYFMDFQMWLSLSLLLGIAHRSAVWQSLVNLKFKSLNA